MADTPQRTEPLDPAPIAGQGVLIALHPPLARWSLRARDRGALAAALDRAVPGQIGAVEAGMACLGPDEWLLRAPAGTRLPDTAGLAMAIADISERQVCMVVSGPRAAEVLMAGCPLDLTRMAAGRATRTVFETVEIIVIRTGADRFEVEVWRSFASWLQLALRTAAGNLR